MAGNKSDNGVHEIGTNDILASYKADTPGEIETKYLENVNEYIKNGKEKQKEQIKASFAMIFDNPLQGYPYNEQYGMDKTLEEIEYYEETVDEAYSKKAKSGAEVAKLMMKKKWTGETWRRNTMQGFANKVKKMKTITADQLDKMLPDYISGGDIHAMFEGQFWGQDKWAKSIDKKLKKTHVRLVKDGKGGMSRATLSKKDKKKIAQLKKNGYKEVPIEAVEEKNMSSGDMIKKLFKLKKDNEVAGVANLMNMTDVKVLQKMQKDNPKGFARLAAHMGKLPAMEEAELDEAKMHYGHMKTWPGNKKAITYATKQVKSLDTVINQMIKNKIPKDIWQNLQKVKHNLEDYIEDTSELVMGDK